MPGSRTKGANTGCTSARRTARAQPKVYDPHGAGSYQDPVWSPDSRKIAYIDNSATLFWIDLGSGQVEKVASAPVFGPDESVMPRPAWSPDSRWIAYALVNRTWYHTVYAYDLETRQSRPITDGLSDAADPVFDAGGKYLYFFASTDAGPVNQWFSQAAEDMRMRRSIYLVVLRKGVPSPLCRESDEEKPADKADDKPKPKDDRSTKDDKNAAKRQAGAGRDRLRAASNSGSWPCPSRRRTTSNLQAGQAGQVFYLDETVRPRAEATRRRRPETLRSRQTQDRDDSLRRRRLTA